MEDYSEEIKKVKNEVTRLYLISEENKKNSSKLTLDILQIERKIQKLKT